MKVDIYVNPLNYTSFKGSYKTSYTPKESKEFDFLDTEERAWQSQSVQSAFTITAARKEMFKQGQIHLNEQQLTALINLPVSYTPFTNALATKQPATSEKAYNEAMSRVINLMDELATLAINEQGITSELGYILADTYYGFKNRADENYDRLQLLKQALKNNQNTNKDIIKAVDTYFAFGALTAQRAIGLFDYISDKFDGLPTAQIMQDLSTIKGWWDNNSRECLKLDDGTKVGFTHAFDKDGNITNTTLVTSLPNGVQRKFNTANLDDENSQILFEMFKQRENLNGLESENLHLNSSENSNLQTKLNLINSSTNSKQNLNFNTLNSSENLIANLNANSTQQSEIFTPNSTNLSLQNSNHRFTMLVESENVTSIINSQSANGDTIIGMWSPMIREKGAQETSRYLSNLINSNSKVAQKPSKAEFERAVKNISALMNELKNFVRSEQGYSQLSVDLQYLAPDDYERTLYESMQTSSNDSYDSLWMGAQIFFDFLNDKVSGLPKDEINAYISTIQAYLVATKLNANELKLTQNSLNFNSENLKLNSNDSLLKELLKNV